MLEKCRNTRLSNNLLGSNMQVNRMMYPFRRATLIALVETINWLQADLSTSLQMLNISMLLVSQSQIDLVLSNSSSCASNIDEVHVAVDRLDQGNGTLSGKLDMIEEHIKTVEFNLLRFKERHSINPILQLSTLDSPQSSSEITGVVLKENQAQCEIPRTGCSCTQCNWSTSTYQTGRASESATACHHGCKHHTENKRVISFIKRRSVYTRIISFSVQASLTITRGTGCFSITPYLNLRMVVPVNSPAFKLLMDTQEELRSRTAGFIIETTHTKLLQLLQEGKASCSDTLPNGNTVLHMITSWQVYSYQWESSTWLTWRAFIKDLLRNGFLPDRINDKGETPADRMVRFFDLFPRKRDLSQQRDTLDICSDLLSSGGHMTQMALDSRHYHSIPLFWKLADEEGIDDIDLPEELLPLVNRSKRHLQVLLRKGNNMRPWVDSYTHWPAGLDLLLRSGYIGSDTLRAACETGSEESVKMCIRSTRCHIGPHSFRLAAKHPNTTIRETVIHGLIERRKRLKALAETFLSDEICFELGITPDTLLGFDAHGTYKALKALPFSINGLYEEFEHGWSVYDSTYSLELADRLWNAGFRDVDGMDKTGGTCLTRMRWSFFRGRFIDFLDRVNWFISKGAEINQKISSSSTLHTLGLTVGEAIWWARDTSEFTLQLSQISEECKILLRRIICDDARDNCSCPFSFNGCSAFTRLLGGLFPTRSDVGTDELFPRLTIMLETIFCLEESPSREYFAGEIVPCVLRFMTSRSLGISHTCRHESYKEYDPDEIKEIQDEEKLLILESNQLFDEFLSKYRELSLGFSDFMAEFWWTRMNEVLSSRETPSAEEISQVLEAGVILYK